MIGSFHGPGGSFEVEVMDFDDLFSMLSELDTKQNEQTRIGKEENWKLIHEKREEKVGPKGI